MYQTLAKINGTYRDSTKDPSTSTPLFVKEVKNWATEKLIVDTPKNKWCLRKKSSTTNAIFSGVRQIQYCDVWNVSFHAKKCVQLAAIDLFKNAIKRDDFQCQTFESVRYVHYSNLTIFWVGIYFLIDRRL